MPLKSGYSKVTISNNIGKLMAEGNGKGIASARSYRQARIDYRKKHPTGVFPAHLKSKNNKKKNPTKKKVAKKKVAVKKRFIKKKVAQKRIIKSKPKLYIIEIVSGKTTYYFDGKSGDTIKANAAYYGSKKKADTIAREIYNAFGKSVNVSVEDANLKK